MNSTIRRFNDYINIKRLEVVVKLEQAEVDEIIRLYETCHGIVEAHDPSPGKNEPPPTPDDLKKDIDNLKKVIQKINDSRK